MASTAAILATAEMQRVQVEVPAPSLVPIYCRKGAGQGDTRLRRMDKRQTESNKKDERAICCGHCGAPITATRHRIRQAGSHLHTVFNPAGIVFEIGCFNEAPGCRLAGESSSEFTWFTGYFWRLALCLRCSAHLGWHYARDGSEFFGLIVNHLRF